MDDRALSSLALALGVLATIASGAWWYTQSPLAGFATIVALLAVIVAGLAILARPLPNEPEPREA
jgi:uncharacterized membrane protein YhaH (DUF805 family)